MSGAAKAFDHSCIIHAIWRELAVMGAEAWIVRVPTKENIADLPSRESYELLQRMSGSRWVRPVLDPVFVSKHTRESLSVLGLLT